MVLGLEKVEIEKEGLKVATNKGEVEMKIKAYLLKDYDAKWERHPMMRLLREFYDKKIVKSRIQQLEDELYEDAYSLMDNTKAFLYLSLDVFFEKTSFADEKDQDNQE